MAGILIFVIALFGSAAVGGAMGLFLGLPTGGMTAALLFLAAVQARSSLTNRRTRKDLAQEIARLKRTAGATQSALEETRSRIEEINTAVEARTAAQSRKIVAELQVLESLMRDFAGKISNRAKDVALPEPAENCPGISARSYLESMGESGLLEIIRASLEENRVDLYLQPIVSLPQRKLRYYEALSRLRAEDGSMIMPAQYIKVAAPAGLMSVVDNLLLFRCVQIVRRLAQKNREIGIFCNISGDTLTDAEFFPQFLEYMRQNRDLAGQIVFEFGQDAVADAGEKGEANLAALAQIGFALSMDHVETLALDFARLKAIGFRHIKLRAETLLEGMGTARAAVGAEDFKQLLQRHGLNLIVERVESEKAVVQLLDYGVDFAQGYLFGEPRAVRDEPPRIPERIEPLAPVVPFRRSA
ncbi:MAG TPA: EAL domain-containing protein [Rhizomicrobium sp.]|jgi:cyclic-di-GMP phosphodiesterase TipF (flagellum assembly factor)|nr:EAL domain-containing protein [Rhizomicrobium sp.]